MNYLIRKTAYVLITLLLFQSSSCAFAFADESYSGIMENENAAAEEAAPEAEENVPEEVTPEKISEETPDAKADIPEEEGSDTADKSKNSKVELKAEPSQTGDQEKTDEQDKPEEEVLNGWVKKDGKKYYYIDGVKQRGLKHIGKYWYYFFKRTGAMKTGWLTKDGERYFFHLTSGRRLTGKKTIKNRVYYFRKSGKMVRGWLKKNGKKYYHRKNGARVFGSRKIGKYHYYFKKKSGIMKKGWLKHKGKRYYYDRKGHKRYGVIRVHKKTYYLNERTGARISKSEYYLFKKIWNKSSSTKYLIYVDKGGRWVNVYKGKKKHWKLVKRYRCTIGKPSTPTPSGTYRVTSKVYHFGESKGYTCWYASGFIGTTYLMHSVVCYSGTKKASDGRLGAAVSHGCVRMKIGNAKWIYDHVPRGTTVFIS